MYKLPNIEDKKMQKIISKELMNGFNNTFHFDSKDTNTISSCVEEFCSANNIPMNSKIKHDLMIYKIVGMYQELADQKNQYTFDELGEYILARLLLCSLADYETFLEAAEDESCEFFMDGNASIEDFWESSISKEDLQYVKEYADRFFSQ